MPRRVVLVRAHPRKRSRGVRAHKRNTTVTVVIPEAVLEGMDLHRWEDDMASRIAVRNRAAEKAAVEIMSGAGERRWAEGGNPNPTHQRVFDQFVSGMLSRTDPDTRRRLLAEIAGRE